MIRKLRLPLFLLSFIFLAVGAPHARSATAPQETVVLFVIDGVRWSEGMGDPQARYCPHLTTELKPLGEFYSNFRNNGFTVTTPGHAALLTGVHANLDNAGKERPHAPTLFERFRKATGGATDTCWVVSHKTKLNVLTHSDAAGFGAPYAAEFRGLKTGGTDELVVTTALRVLEKYPVRLMLIAVAEPDLEGHSKHWQGYLRAIERTDALAAKVWTWLQASPAYRGRTTMYITNDHGRHLQGIKSEWHSHGDDCEGCRHISCLILGPGGTPGRTVTDEHDQRDVFKWMATRLGVPTTP